MLVRNFSAYTSITGTLHVVGEVVNNLGQAAEFVEITANFYSGSGTLLATDFTFADVSIIAPGTDSPFDLLLLDPPPGITNYTLSVTDFTAPPFGGSQPITGLALAITNTYTSLTGTLHIVGTVTNTSTKTYDFVQPIFALYGSDGRVTRVDFTFTTPSTLGPGQTGTFDALVLSPGSYATIRSWVDAND